jgi:hypothetical protein
MFIVHKPCNSFLKDGLCDHESAMVEITIHNEVTKIPTNLLKIL